ncbi:hypothetical protein LNQ52_13205 [Klebsiella pneumoniae subsp. pneumoniae]|nr:hypothetical protein [Klebsiella pneumoniae subsp. pneumoniae]
MPAAGPVPPPMHGGHAGDQRLFACWRTESSEYGYRSPPAVTIFPSAAITSVAAPMGMSDVGLDVGVTGFADGEDPAVLHADIGLNELPSDRRSTRW